MDIKQLINFITIVEEGNITRAAKKLHISQPPLSNQMKLLEQELGVKLIERGSRKIELTDVGQLLYKRSKNMVKLFESTLNEIDDFKSGEEGILKIGSVSTCSQFVPDELISNYAKKYPKVRYELHEGNTYEVVDMVEKGFIDIGVVRTPFNINNICCMNLRTEEMVAVVAEEVDCFSFDDGKISVEDLDKKPIIIYRRYEKLLMEVFKEKNINPKIYCLNDDSRTTVAWAKFGLGIGIVPKSIVKHNLNNKLKFYKINDKALETEIMIIWRENKYLSKSARHLIDMIKEMEF